MAFNGQTNRVKISLTSPFERVLLDLYYQHCVRVSMEGYDCVKGNIRLGNVHKGEKMPRNKRVLYFGNIYGGMGVLTPITVAARSKA
jgi:hypothetical protein